jgi:hypothetical protein
MNFLSISSSVCIAYPQLSTKPGEAHRSGGKETKKAFVYSSQQVQNRHKPHALDPVKMVLSLSLFLYAFAFSAESTTAQPGCRGFCFPKVLP